MQALSGDSGGREAVARASHLLSALDLAMGLEQLAEDEGVDTKLLLACYELGRALGPISEDASDE